MALKRINKDLAEITKDAPTNITAGPTGDNYFQWQATMLGPEKSPYAGGYFFLDIKFPDNYPMSAPKMKFATKIYHCNVKDDGQFCLEILKDKWSPQYTITYVLKEIYALLETPNTEDPLVPEIAQKYKEKKDEHDKTAAEWTKKYAM